MNQESEDEAKERLKLLSRSYGEVLDATKHQDDKIGRFFTGIAFFTVAAAALVSRSPFLQIRYEVDGYLVLLPALLYAAFFALVILAVLLFIIALGPNLKLPGHVKKRGVEPYTRSHLFFPSLQA